MRNIRTFSVFIFSLFVIGTAYTQNAKSYFDIADSLRLQKESTEAEGFYKKAIDAYAAEENWDSVAFCVYRAIINYSDRRKNKKALQQVTTFLPIIEKHSELIPPLRLARIYIIQALCLRRIEDYNASIKTYKKAIAVYEKHSINSTNVAYAYKNAAQIFVRQQNYPQAIDYLKRALDSDSTHYYDISIYNSLAGAYHFLEDDQMALTYYNRAKDWYPKARKSRRNAKDLALLNVMAAVIYTNKKAYDQAEEAALEALEYYEAIPQYWEETIKRYIGLADIMMAKGQTQKTEQYYKMAEDLLERVQQKSREGARLFEGIGDYYLEKQQTDKALQYYQKALIQVSPNFNSIELSNNPALEDFYPESFLVSSTAKKAEALKARYDTDGKLSDLQLASECYSLTFEAINHLSETFGSEEAKLQMGSYSRQYYEEALLVLHELYRKTKQADYLNDFFSLIEQSRATVLKEAAQRHRAIILSGVPDSLLAKEQALRKDIADYRVSIMQEQLLGADKDSLYIEELELALADQRNAYDGLLRQLQQDYPRFRSYIAPQAPPSLQEVQRKLLRPDEALLTYFVGDEDIFLLKLLSEETQLYRIKRSPQLDEQLNTLLRYLRSTAVFNNNLRHYQQLGHQFFQLLCPGITTLDKGLSRLIILPDGPLALLPFDALLTEPPSEALLPIEYFLGYQFTLSYAWSANLLLQARPETQATRQIAIAPVFANKERGLAPLLNSDEELEAIPATDQLMAGQATAARFRQLAPASRLIHLSTHAEAGKGEAASIAFIDTTMFLPEIYALDLQADLVVLSACETGLGKLEKGEGVMSLARGFRYAGARSLIASLWQVSEKTTAKLFSGFYTQLSQDLSKAESLHQAKRTYLETVENEGQKAPYYWAGLTYVGRDEKLELNSGTWSKWLWGGLLSLLFVGGFYFLRRN